MLPQHVGSSRAVGHFVNGLLSLLGRGGKGGVVANRDGGANQDMSPSEVPRIILKQPKLLEASPSFIQTGFMLA